MNPIIITYIVLNTAFMWLIVWAIYEATPIMDVQFDEKIQYAVFVGIPALLAAYGTALIIQIMLQ